MPISNAAKYYDAYLDNFEEADVPKAGGAEMNIYMNLVILGITGFALLAFSAFQVVGPYVSFGLSVFSYAIFLIIALINTRTWLEKEHDRKIRQLKEKYERKIRRMRFEHDTATLEKTIRDGTKTLIKNAVDYFKIENIKNEMPPSAAIQNLQLDKYGQIIELLADFSLILPDFEENREIVLQEINHQIEVYQIDEKTFAEFLRSIMGKYILTVNKKMREKRKIKSETNQTIRSCPNCLEKVTESQSICPSCGRPVDGPSRKVAKYVENACAEWLKQGHLHFSEGNFKEAIHMFSMAVDLNPTADQAYFNRGLAYRRMGMIEEALADLEKSVELGHPKARAIINTIRLMNPDIGPPPSPSASA